MTTDSPHGRALARDRRFMGHAIKLARAQLGRTSPNPAVGCVIVRGDKIIARGATADGGRPHAEAVAIAQAGGRARGATAYVSLEPCAHQGRTPPCARSLVRAGVRRVVIGCLDHYPAVRGRGAAILRRAGLEVTVGVREQECRQLVEGFFTRVERARPFGLLKLAMSLDGRIAAQSGDSHWISSAASRAIVHRWRSESDAVVVGARTVVADNPRLTARVARGHDPVRVVVDAHLRVSPGSKIFTERSTACALIVTTRANLDRARVRYRGSRVEVIGIKNAGANVDLSAMMQAFAKRGWNQVLFEGGAHLAGSALAAGVIDRVAIFVGPKLVGAGLAAVEGLATVRINQALRLDGLAVRHVGSDLLIEGCPAHPRRK